MNIKPTKLPERGPDAIIPPPPGEKRITLYDHRQQAFREGVMWVLHMLRNGKAPSEVIELAHSAAAESQAIFKEKS